MAAIEISAAEIGAHALAQMARRNIAESELRAILAKPSKISSAREGRVVVQGPVLRAGKSVYLLRAFIDVDRTPPVVVTVYLTSKFAKYEGGS